MFKVLEQPDPSDAKAFRRWAWARLGQIILQFLLALAVGLTATEVIRWVTPTFLEVYRYFEQRSFIIIQIAVPILALVCGTLLYWHRCYSPRWYGLLEITFGILGANYIFQTTTGSLGDRFTYIFAIAASLYVIVRGYDNVYKSLGDGPTRLWWNRLFFRRESREKL